MGIKFDGLLDLTDYNVIYAQLDLINKKLIADNTSAYTIQNCRPVTSERIYSKQHEIIRDKIVAIIQYCAHTLKLNIQAKKNGEIGKQTFIENVLINFRKDVLEVGVISVAYNCIDEIEIDGNLLILRTVDWRKNHPIETAVRLGK